MQIVTYGSIYTGENLGRVALEATDSTAPTVTDDASKGFIKSSRWIDTSTLDEYVCLDPTVDAAIWKSTTTGGSGPVVIDSEPLSVVLDPDGSIVTNPLSPGPTDPYTIRVGVLATDAQHGHRGGGSQHSVVNTTDAGFAPVLPNNVTLFLNGIGGYTKPAGTPLAIMAAIRLSGWPR